MATRGGKKQLNIWLSEDAHQGWADFCAEHGVDSITALVEAVGLALSANDLPVTPGAWEGVCDEARTIAQTRRRRGRY